MDKFLDAVLAFITGVVAGVAIALVLTLAWRAMDYLSRYWR